MLLLLAFVAIRGDASEAFTGKVVGVTDGDTISVLRAGQAVKVRLDGIDCPERGDPFSAAAKKLTSKLAFGKEVRVEQTDVDHWGRVVGRVDVGGIDLSVALVRAGLAWHYVKYSSDPILATAEAAARAAKVGLWSEPSPRPPWEVRQGRKGDTASASPASSQPAASAFRGNQSSHVFHTASCQHSSCKNCVVPFSSREQAIAAGYRPAGCCRP